MTVLLNCCVLLLLASTIARPTVCLPVTVTVSFNTMTSALEGLVSLLMLICWLLLQYSNCSMQKQISRPPDPILGAAAMLLRQGAFEVGCYMVALLIMECPQG